MNSAAQAVYLAGYGYLCKPVKQEVLHQLVREAERVWGNLIRDETNWAFLIAKIYWLC